MHVAADNNNEALVTVLLWKNADINVLDAVSTSICCEGGDSTIVFTLSIIVTVGIASW